MDSINMKAADDCYLTTGPCGGRPMGPPQEYLRAGQNFTVVIQKNFGHFYKTAPGMFEIKFGIMEADGNMLMDTLATIPDTDAPPLTLITQDIVVSTNNSLISFFIT